MSTKKIDNSIFCTLLKGRFIEGLNNLPSKWKIEKFKTIADRYLGTKSESLTAIKFSNESGIFRIGNSAVIKIFSSRKAYERELLANLILSGEGICQMLDSSDDLLVIKFEFLETEKIKANDIENAFSLLGRLHFRGISALVESANVIPPDFDEAGLPLIKAALDDWNIEPSFSINDHKAENYRMSNGVLTRIDLGTINFRYPRWIDLFTIVDFVSDTSSLSIDIKELCGVYFDSCKISCSKRKYAVEILGALASDLGFESLEHFWSNGIELIEINGSVGQ